MSAFKGTDFDLIPRVFPPCAMLTVGFLRRRPPEFLSGSETPLRRRGVRPEKWLPREEVEEDNENWENGDGDNQNGKNGDGANAEAAASPSSTPPL